MSKKKPLSRSEFVEVIQKGNHETKRRHRPILCHESIRDSFVKGDNVSLIGFGF